MIYRKNRMDFNNKQNKIKIRKLNKINVKVIINMIHHYNNNLQNINILIFN